MNPNAEEFYTWYMQEQSQSTLTFSPIPAYSPMPEIVPDADEIISQPQHANAAAADTEDTTGAIRLVKQAANNSETKEQSSDAGVIQKWKALKKHWLRLRLRYQMRMMEPCALSKVMKKKKGKPLLTLGMGNRRMENEQIQDMESSIVETSEQEAAAEDPSSTPEFEEEIVSDLRK